MLEKENRPLLTNNAELDGLVSVLNNAMLCLSMCLNLLYPPPNPLFSRSFIHIKLIKSKLYITKYAE